jgi:hypothetical protein
MWLLASHLGSRVRLSKTLVLFILTNMTNRITPCGRIFIKKLAVTKLANEFPPCMKSGISLPRSQKSSKTRTPCNISQHAVMLWLGAVTPTQSPSQRSISCRLFATAYSAEFYLLRYNAVESDESQPKFQRNISLPYLGLKIKLRKKPTRNRYEACWYLLSVLFDSADESDMLFRNVGWFSPEYTAL